MLMFLYKLEQDKIPISISCNFTRNSHIHRYSTRQSQIYHVPRVLTDSTKQSVIYNAVTLYNKSIEYIDYSKRPSFFKNCIKKFIAQSLNNM